MHRELKILFTAIMFYTRIPVPKGVGFSDDNLNKATRYFPLIGILVGGFGALAFMLSQTVLSNPIAILISMILTILLTGAFHEDGFADFCDGFGGGYTKEKILAIMKDSRIGVYGAIALILILLSKFMLLNEIRIDAIPIVFISAHAFSRLNPVLLIMTSSYVRQDETSKSKPVGNKISFTTLFVALIFGLAPLFLLPIAFIPFMLVTQALILLAFRQYIHKKIGGYTGDVLGALQQLSEIAYYLCFIVLSGLL
ncbi:MAG: adenosylcobinamide-GDP ribazoletransferase [Bacteroidales bacterium]|nr:adenosylcobinamide-GDP ribazoletransferase [Bacteroidales bacterium]